MTDVLLRQSPDGGDITTTPGQVNDESEITPGPGLLLMSDGLETAAYLSLFGGNQDDAGDDAGVRAQWWGNFGETEAARTYRSETQHLIQSLPAVPRNLRRIEQAVARDLAWMIAAGVAKSVSASASIPEINRVTVAVTIVTLKEQVQLVFG